MLFRSLVLGLAMGSATGWPQTPDFTGRWRLVDQETSAWRGRSGTGAHEEDQVIAQSAGRLAVHYEPGDGAWDHAYGLAPGAARGGDGPWSVSRWEGRTLVTEGRRAFRTADGPASYEFEERRTLSADGSRMTVVTRIRMFPKDLVRTAAYERRGEGGGSGAPVRSR